MSNRATLRCLRCLYGDQRGYCSYILATLHRRPCPPGEGCTVFKPRTGKREPEPIVIVPPTSKSEPRPTSKPPKPTRPRGKLWDTAKARALYDGGASDRDIATACGISPSAIGRWRNRLRLPPHTPPRPPRTFDTSRARALYDEGRTDIFIAMACDVCVGTISNWRHQEGLPSKHRGGARV